MRAGSDPLPISQARCAFSNVARLPSDIRQSASVSSHLIILCRLQIDAQVKTGQPASPYAPYHRRFFQRTRISGFSHQTYDSGEIRSRCRYKFTLVTSPSIGRSHCRIVSHISTRPSAVVQTQKIAFGKKPEIRRITVNILFCHHTPAFCGFSSRVFCFLFLTFAA